MRYILESPDVPPGKPPTVVFDVSEDMRTLTAGPEGATILVEWMREGLSRIQLWDLERGGRSVDLDLRHPENEQWRNAMSYACEVACALYWSQWRSQLAARAARDTEPAPESA